MRRIRSEVLMMAAALLMVSAGPAMGQAGESSEGQAPPSQAQPRPAPPPAQPPAEERPTLRRRPPPEEQAPPPPPPPRTGDAQRTSLWRDIPFWLPG